MSNYALEIEQSFKQLKAQVLSVNGKGTGCEDVLQYLYENQTQIWFMSWEFVGKQIKSGKILSHKAPARASDLAIHESHLVEDRKIGRFKAYRLRLENLNLIQKRLGYGLTEQVKKVEVEKCQHGVPSYVVCPNCNKNLHV